MLQHKCKDIGVNIEDEELVKIFNLILKRRETILFFLIVMVNGLTWIVSDIRLNTYPRGRWIIDLNNQINLDSNFVRPIKSINRLICARLSFLFVLFSLLLCLHQHSNKENQNTWSLHKRNQMSLLEISTSLFAVREPTSSGGKERSSFELSCWLFLWLLWSNL